MNLIDLHCDTLWKIMDLDKKGNLLRNDCAVSLGKLKEANAMAQFFACFVYLPDLQGATTEEKYDTGYRQVLKMAEYLRVQAEAYPEDMFLVKERKSFVRAQTEMFAAQGGIFGLQAGKKIGAFLTIEDGGILNGRMERLEELNKQGVSLMTILWNYENCIGYPNSREEKVMASGLKPFGIEVVERMGELGMIVDVSHASDGTFWDALKHAKGPVVASHSNCRAICGHFRNLSDEMIRALAEKGGVAGLNFYGCFLDGSNESRMDAMVEHLKHMVKVGGSDFPAIGTDFDGFDGMIRMEIPDIGQMGRLAQELTKAGFKAGQIEKIWSGNVMRVLEM